MVTRLEIIALIVLLMIGIGGCIEEKKGISTKPVSTEVPTPEYKVEYWPVTENGIVYLMIVVRGEANYIELMLSDPEVSILNGCGLLSEADLKDVIGRGMIEMGKYGEIPKAESYTLMIKELPSGEIVYKTEVTISGAQVHVRGAEFVTEFQESIDQRTVTMLKLLISNEGDLPISITKAVVLIHWCEGDGSTPMYRYKEPKISLSYTILPKESKVITENLEISGLESSTYYVRIILCSGQREIAYYDTELLLE